MREAGFYFYCFSTFILIDNLMSRAPFYLWLRYFCLTIRHTGSTTPKKRYLDFLCNNYLNEGPPYSLLSSFFFSCSFFFFFFFLSTTGILIGI
ncbi:expressed protein, partial [Phakopsora pachyrhizi]